jgi:hypothetical protein
MDPIYPWLDPVEVRHLADQLMKPGQQPVADVPDAGFDDAFVGFASEPAAKSFLPSPEFREVTPPPVPVPVPSSGGVTGVSPVSTPAPAPDLSPAPSPPEIPAIARGPFLDRIGQLRDWMHRQFSASGIFILDREGAVIFDESSHGRLHFLARSLALASRRPGSNSGNVHVKIGAGATLEVIPVDTAYGCLVLGAVVPEAMDPASVSAVMEALALVTAPPVAES